MDANTPMELRYYLSVRDQDVDDPVDVDDFVARVNGDLVNNAANLASRSIRLLVDRFGGKVGTNVGPRGAALVDAAKQLAREAWDEKRCPFDDPERARAARRLRFAAALNLSAEANRYLSAVRPWEKVDTEPDMAHEPLTTAVIVSVAVARVFLDVMPDWLELLEQAGDLEDVHQALMAGRWPLADSTVLTGYTPLVHRLDADRAREMLSPALLPAHNEVEGVQRRGWGEFREAGMVYAANTILQWFGWSLVVCYDDKSGKLLDVYPARADHRGFSAESSASGIERLTRWMEKASPALLAEVHHEPPAVPPMVVDARRPGSS